MTFPAKLSALVVLGALTSVPSVAPAQEPGGPRSSVEEAAPELAPPATAEEDGDAPGAPRGVEAASSAQKPRVGGADLWGEEFDELDHVMALDQLNLRADDVQRKLSVLEDRVGLLRESIIIGSITPSRAVITHNNQMGRSFSLQELAYFLDGQLLLTKIDRRGLLDQQRQFEVLSGTLSPGDHLLEVQMVFVGTGKGLYSEFRGYRFKVGSKYRLRVAEGRLTRCDVVAEYKQDIALSTKDRMKLRYDIDIAVMPE